MSPFLPHGLSESALIAICIVLAVLIALVVEFDDLM